MKPGRFFWKLFAGNLVLLAMILGVSVWVIVNAMERAYVADVAAQLQATALHIRNIAIERDLFHARHRGALESLAEDIGGMDTSLRRITIINMSGDVLADSDAAAVHMESHADRPEIMAAIRSGQGVSRRWSETVQRELMYVARRIDGVGGGDGRGVVRVSTPVFRVAEQTGAMAQLIWTIGGIGLLAASILALAMAHLWSRPIRRITEAAHTLSRGDLTARTVVRGKDEIAQLATSLNQMRANLADQLHTIDQQRLNLAYFIQTLSEGVIVADGAGEIMLINQAACRFLRPAGNGAAPAAVVQRFVGRNVEDCVPHAELRRLLRSEEAGGAGIQELPLQVPQDGGTVHLLARASDIDFDTGRRHGGTAAASRLVVLTDVTELTRTIRMKTDFVANASHELRTPLSTLRASVETLQQIDFAKDPDSARRFMEVIERHTGRLEELVSDLLDLSRLESDATAFPVECTSMMDVIDDVYARFEHALKGKGLRWEWRCAEGSEHVRANGRLLRLVLDNLVSNAVKFTGAGGGVRVWCERGGDVVVIAVRDDGCGIPAADQQRVFERFYQVEAARSDAGPAGGVKRGTGLGLSIVRHAVAAMGATISLESAPGAGTTVTVRIPSAAQAASRHH